MSIQSQDVLIALKLAVDEHSNAKSYAQLAAELGISSKSRVHASLKRAAEHGFLFGGTRRVKRGALLEFLKHGAKYNFPAGRSPFEQGATVRGTPTAHSAAPLNQLIQNGGPDIVWPDPVGAVDGECLKPIHSAAPTAARNDPRMHQALALVDALRIGRARERELAADLLTEMILGA